MRRFEREAAILNMLKGNPYIIKVIDSDTSWELPYIVLEYAECSLRSWVQAAHPWKPVVELLAHVVQGLAFIHEKNGYHRDIKPDNILLVNVPGQGLVAKLGDFGLSMLPMDGTTATNGICGTQLYFPPEVINGATEYAQSMDIYALGLSFIEVLTGTRNRLSITAHESPDFIKMMLLSMTSENPKDRPKAPLLVEALLQYSAFCRAHRTEMKSIRK